MHAAIGTLNRPAPAAASGDFGTLRASVLLAHIADQKTLVPESVADELDNWAAHIMASAQGPALGLAASEVPVIWSDLLAWSGVPMSKTGPMHWGVDIYEANVPLPEFQGTALALPPPQVLAQLTSLALKPLRMLATRHLHVRLQGATGLQLFLWSNQAVLISRAEMPLGGFLHGPGPGTRHSFQVPVGDAQIINW